MQSFFPKKWTLPRVLPQLVHSRSYFLQSEKIIIPHPLKTQTGGEDAAFSGTKYLAVADGVGGWSNVGINSGLYSRELLIKMQECLRAHAKHSKYTPLPLDILKSAYLQTRAIGTSTVCTVFLDEYNRELKTLNLGDSGYFVYRKSEGKIIDKSDFLCHGFNRPVQIGTGSSDLPEHAVVGTVPIKDQDWIVLGSDGLWGNVYDEEILSILNTEEEVKVALQKIATMAWEFSSDQKRLSPFNQQEIQENGSYKAIGGKLDDITVILAKVRDPWAMSRKEVPDSVAVALQMDEVYEELKRRSQEKKKRK